MQSRDALSEAIPDLDSRVAFLTFDLINQIIQPSKDVLGHKHWLFKDSFKEARGAFSKLIKAHQQFAETMFLEEQSRRQYAIPRALYKAYKNAELSLKHATRKYEQVVKNIEKEKNALRDKASQLSSDIQIKRLEIANKQGAQIQGENQKYNQLMGEKAGLLKQQQRLNIEIDSKCCRCFPSRTAKERDELLRVETGLESIDREMRLIDQARLSRKQEEDAIKQLMLELTETRKQLAEHNEQVAKGLRDAEHVRLSKQVDLAEMKIAIDKQRKRYNASLSVKSMLQAVRMYYHFIRFKTEMDIQYDIHARQNKKNDRLHELRFNLSKTKDRLEEYVEQLWLPEARNIPASAIFKRFKALDPDEQLAFLQGDKAEVIEKVLQLDGKAVSDLLSMKTKNRGETMRFFSPKLAESDDEQSEEQLKNEDNKTDSPHLAAI